MGTQTETLEIGVQRWVEPNRSTPLRWGNYDSRYALTLIALLLYLGLWTYSFVDRPSVPVAWAALVAGLAAWMVAPAPAGRRFAALGIVTLALIGSWSVAGIVLAPLFPLAWFVLRQRPGRSYWWLFLSPLAIVFPWVFVPLIAWLGRITASRTPGSEQRREAQLRSEQEWRVDQIKHWEAAYRQAHEGAEPPAGFAPPITPMPLQPQTNTFAILALVFGVLGGLIAIPFGHIGIHQTKGGVQGGRGMAVTGLVLGYLWLVALVIYFIALAALLS